MEAFFRAPSVARGEEHLQKRPRLLPRSPASAGTSGISWSLPSCSCCPQRDMCEALASCADGLLHPGLSVTCSRAAPLVGGSSTTEGFLVPFVCIAYGPSPPPCLLTGQKIRTVPKS